MAGWGDHTRTLTWDISDYDASDANWMQIIFSQNMGGVTTAGNFYIDNVKLIGNDTASQDDGLSVWAFGEDVVRRPFKEPPMEGLALLFEEGSTLIQTNW